MKQALMEAQNAFKRDEVPIGAIITCNNKIIAKACNLVETLNDATAHAEMQAFTSASEQIGSKYLNECDLYVTLEPCSMCFGASYWTRIKNIYFGAYEHKNELYQNKLKNIIHKQTTVQGGILENECAELLQNFFKKKRI